MMGKIFFIGLMGIVLANLGCESEDKCAEGMLRGQDGTCGKEPTEASICGDAPCIHGSCTDQGLSGMVCVCDSGYTGEHCDACDGRYGLVRDEATGDCVKQEPSRNICNGHGTMVNGACFCDARIEGESCERCASGYVAYPACVVDDRKALCVSHFDDCHGDLTAARCCVGTTCEFRFSDGKVLTGKSAASGYCLGESDGSQDGDCGGTDAHVCMYRYTPDACNAEPKCFWSDPVRTFPEGCLELYPYCVKGRRFFKCCPDGKECDYLFEDGRLFCGWGSKHLYCMGEEVSEDGSCTSERDSLKDFCADRAFTRQQCEQIKGCTWNSSPVCTH